MGNPVPGAQLQNEGLHNKVEEFLLWKKMLNLWYIQLWRVVEGESLHLFKVEIPFVTINELTIMGIRQESGTRIRMEELVQGNMQPTPTCVLKYKMKINIENKITKFLSFIVFPFN